MCTHYKTTSMHFHSSKVFQPFPECNERHHGLGDLIITNKLPFLIDR
jgi:hypothetical protein